MSKPFSELERQLIIDNQIGTIILMQIPILIGGFLTHTFFCIEPESRPNSFLTTGVACIWIGVAANAYYFTR